MTITKEDWEAYKAALKTIKGDKGATIPTLASVSGLSAQQIKEIWLNYEALLAQFEPAPNPILIFGGSII